MRNMDSDIETMLLPNEVFEGIRDKEKKYNFDKQQLRKRNFKPTKTKSKIMKHVPKIGIAVASVALASTLAGTAVYLNSDRYKQIKKVMILESEVDAHGGRKDLETGGYINSLPKHLESGNCEMPKSMGEDVDSRIIEYCKQNNISDAIADAAISKFFCYYREEYEKGDSIDLVKMYKEELKQEKEEEKSLMSK